MNSIDFFKKGFRAITGHPPFPWQEAAFASLIAGNLPEKVNLPTGTGKTSFIPVWLLAVAWQAQKGSLTIPRRLVWIVNRRVVVDQATDEAIGLLRKITGETTETDTESRAILEDLCQRISCLSFAAKRGHSPLVVSTLRGQMADNAEWCLDPSRPSVVIGTIDMIGSRLLFSGYGLGRTKRPFQAGLLANDTWIVLDEAHLTPAFAELLHSCQAFRERTKPSALFSVTLLTATQRPSKTDDKMFSLSDADYQHTIIGPRLTAIKQLYITSLPRGTKKDEEVKELVACALAHRANASRILVYVCSPKTAAEVANKLAKEAPECPVRVLTGTMRGHERDLLVDDDKVFCGYRATLRRMRPPVTTYLVATSAGEVGADLDADGIVMDLTTLESSIQRFGRANRLGLGAARIDLVVPADVIDGSPKAKTLAYFQNLPVDHDGGRNVSPSALQYPPHEAFSPSPPTIPLAAHWLDLWAMTSIRDGDWPERPQVGPWLHGVSRDVPETYFAWRDDITFLSQPTVAGSDRNKVFDVFPLRPHELLREPVKEAWDKLRKLAQSRGNGIQPVVVIGSDGTVSWLGTLSELTGDDFSVNLNYATVVLPSAVGGLSLTGLLTPSEPHASDVADVGRSRWLVFSHNNRWKATRLVAGGGLAEVIADSVKELISPLCTGSPMTSVAIVPLGSLSEDDHGDQSFLLYLLDPSTTSLTSAASFVASGAQGLVAHCERVASVAQELAERCGLHSASKAVALAGDQHDRGKGRICWQKAIGNCDAMHPLAKSGHARFNRVFNGGYRHEFGSLLETAERQLGDDVNRELVLHLVASHHGHSRPHFRPSGYDKESPLKFCQEAAVASARRFGLMQQKLGWWGLAWHEAVVKAADAIVSQGLDQGDDYA